MSAHNVLLIDDDTWLREQLERTLTKAGYQTRTVSNALHAMDEIDTSRPDVIILDLFMPGPNGLVLLHELQSHSDLAKIPVILCTNSAADLSREQLAPYGVRGVLDKTTMQPRDIVAAVKRVL